VGSMQPPNVKVLSHSSPYGGQMGVLANVFALLLAACALLLLPGCRNMFQPPNTDGSKTGAAYGLGTLLLTINGQGLGRTIRPDIDDDDFVRVDLEFVARSVGNYDFYVENWDRGSIELGVGTWDLYVTAFLPSGVAAEGSLEGIQVLPDDIVVDDIALSPIEGGEGTFSWYISFSPSFFPEITVTSARMEIRYGTLSGGVIGDGIINFVVDGTSLYGSRSMPAGQYFVVFEMLDDDGERVGVNEALHIFRNMESRVEWDFTPGDFPVSLLDWVLGSWNDDNDEWNFAARGIIAGHFDHLGIDGVHGAGAPDFGLMVNWFNDLSRDFYPPTNAAELRALVDAALIGIGRGTIAAVNHGNRALARDAITGLVRNSSLLEFGWDNDYTVTVQVGVYEVPITFDYPHPLPPPTNVPDDPDYPVPDLQPGQDPGRLAKQLAWLRNNAQAGNSYLIYVIDATEIITPAQAQLPTVAGDLTIILRGVPCDQNVMPSVNLAQSANGAIFTISNGVSLVLDGVTLTGRHGNTNVLVRVNSGGTLVMNAGTTIGINSGNFGCLYGGGGAVHVEAGARFDMYGGTIFDTSKVRSSPDNRSTGGGVANWGIFNMHGGIIGPTNIADYGAGVYVGAGGVFNMHNGTISGNNSYSGGGVYVGAGGVFNMYNGTISGNTSTAAPWNEFSYGGGGVYVGDNGVFNMHSGTISGNTSSSYGGGVHVGTGGWFNMHNGQILGNTSTSAAGGGVRVGSTGTFRVENGRIPGQGAPMVAERNNAFANASLSNNGTAERGTFAADGTFTWMGNLPSTNVYTSVSNGN